jgi:transposase
VLLYDKEWSFQEIAEVLLLTEEAIRHHVSEYKSSKKLKPEGGGSEEKLSAEQVQKLESHLETSKIILHFLPPYSPNLNPIERLWKLKMY